MANTSGIRAHMKTVGSISKITGAMQMVASARMHQAQQRANASLPYAEKLRDLLSEAISDPSAMSHLDLAKNPLLEKRPVYRTAYVIMGSDKGLAGPYNSNVIKYAEVELKDKPDSIILAVGKQIALGLNHWGHQVQKSWTGFSEKPSFEAAEEIADYVENLFTHKEVDKVDMVYTYFKSAMVQLPKNLRLLPVEAAAGSREKEQSLEVWDKDDVTDFHTLGFVPEPGDMLPFLAKYYLESQIFSGLIQSSACELASRMAAMSTAIDNAENLLSKLKIHYQKVRQASITTEINEIVSGAEALK